MVNHKFTQQNRRKLRISHVNPNHLPIYHSPTGSRTSSPSPIPPCVRRFGGVIRGRAADEAGLRERAEGHRAAEDVGILVVQRGGSGYIRNVV